MGALKPKTRIGDLLIAAHLVTQAQVDEALAIAKVMRMQLGQVFVELGGQNPRIPKLTEHQIEAALAGQDHGRAGARPVVEKDATVRALDAAIKADNDHAATRVETAEAARKITLNSELDPIDASTQIGDE